MSGLIICVVCVFKEQLLTGRLSEADGVAVNVRWEEKRRRRLKGLSTQSVNTQGGLLRPRSVVSDAASQALISCPQI